MKFFRLFNNKSEFDTYIGNNPDLPNVSAVGTGADAKAYYKRALDGAKVFRVVDFYPNSTKTAFEVVLNKSFPAGLGTPTSVKVKYRGVEKDDTLNGLKLSAMAGKNKFDVAAGKCIDKGGFNLGYNMFDEIVLTYGSDVYTILGFVHLYRYAGNVVAPVAKALTYGDSSVAVATAGSSDTGVMQYALTPASVDTPSKDDFDGEIPSYNGLDAGSYKLWYYSKGDDMHLDTDMNAYITITVAPKTLTVTADNKSIVYGTATPTQDFYSYTVKTSDLKGTDTTSIVTGTPVYSCAYRGVDGDPNRVVKSYPITLSGLSAGKNYTINYVAGNLSVTQLTASLSWGTTSWIYDGAHHSTTCTVNNKAYTGDDVNILLDNNLITNVSESPKTVKATSLTGVDKGNYILSGINQVDISITKKKPVLSFATTPTMTGTTNYLNPASLNKSGHLYGSFVPSSTAGGTIGLSSTGSRLEFSTSNTFTSKITSVNSGTTVYYRAKDIEHSQVTTKITISQTDGQNDDNYSAADSVSNSTSNNIYIKPVQASVTISGKTLTYNGGQQTLVSYSNLVGGTISFKVDNVSATTPQAKDVKIVDGSVSSYEISWEITPYNNYSPNDGSVTSIINPAAVTVTADNKTINYGGAKPTFSYKDSGLKTGDTLSGTISYACSYDVNTYANRVVGNYSITPSGLSNSNYNVTFVNGTLTVNPRVVELEWSANPSTTNYTWDYDKSEKSVSCSIKNKVGSDDVTVTLENNKITNAGTKTAEASSLSGTAKSNYTLTGASNTTQVITVNKIPSTLSFSSDVNNTSLNPYALNVSGHVYGDFTPVSDAGGTISLSSTGSRLEFSTSNTFASKITSVTSGTKVYYRAKDIEHSQVTTKITISQTDAQNNDDYGAASASVSSAKTITISPIQASVTISGKTLTYNGGQQTLVSYSNLVGGTISFKVDNVSVTTPQAKDVKRGSNNSVESYTITWEITPNNNYSTNSGSVTSKINPAAITVTAKSYTGDNAITYGDAAPTNYTVSYSSFVNGETAATAFTTQPSCSCAYTATAGNANRVVGNYSITPSGAVAKNYSITYKTGTLTVNKAPITITVDNKSISYNDAKPTFTFTATGFKYNETVSVLTGITATYACSYSKGSAVGNYEISATITPTQYDNYYIDTTTSGTLTVSSASASYTAPVLIQDTEYTASNINLISSYSTNHCTMTFFVASGDESYVTTIPPSPTASQVTETSINALNAGTYHVWYKVTVDSGYQLPTPSDNGKVQYLGSVTITKAPLEIYGLYDIVYGDELPNNNNINWNIVGLKGADACEIDSYTTPYVRYGNVGAYTLIPNYIITPNEQNYDIAASGGLKVNERRLTLTWGSTRSWTYDGNTHYATYTLGNIVNNDDVGITLSNNSIINVGNKTVTVNNALSGAKAANYLPPTNNSTTISITAADCEYTVPTIKTQTLTYNGQNQSLINAGSSSVCTLTYYVSSTTSTTQPTSPALANVNKAASAIVGKNAGSGNEDLYYHIWYTFNHTNNNYTHPNANEVIYLGYKQINRKSLTVTADNKSITYGDNPPTYTLKYTNGFVNSETASTAFTTLPTVTTSPTYAKGSNAGSYTIIPNKGISSNYAVTPSNGTLTVGKADGYASGAVATENMVWSMDSVVASRAKSASGDVLYCQTLYPVDAPAPSKTVTTNWSGNVPSKGYSYDAGTYRLYYYAKVSTNYTESALNYVDVIINKDPLSIEPTVPNILNYGNPHNILATLIETGGFGTAMYWSDYTTQNAPSRIGETGSTTIGGNGNWSESIPTTTATTPAGDYKLWVYIKGDNNHYDSDVICIDFTVFKAAWPGSVTAKTGLVCTGSSQKVVNITPAGQNVYARINGGNWFGANVSPTAIDAGTHTVEYYVTGTTNYASVGSATSPISLTVTIGTGTGTAKTLTNANAVYGTTNAVATASGTSTGTMRYALTSASASAPASSAYTTTIPTVGSNNAGTYKLWYYCDASATNTFGERNFAAVGSVSSPMSISVTIAKAESRLSAKTPDTPVAITSNSIYYNEVRNSYRRLSLPANNLLFNAISSGKYSEGTLTVKSVTSTSFPDMYYQSGDFYINDYIEGDYSSLTDAGTYTISVTYHDAGDANHNAKDVVVLVSFRIKKSIILIGLPSIENVTYDGTAHNIHNRCVFQEFQHDAINRVESSDFLPITFEYGVSTSNTVAPTSSNGSNIIKKTAAGIYYMWFKYHLDDSYYTNWEDADGCSRDTWLYFYPAGQSFEIYKAEGQVSPPAANALIYGTANAVATAPTTKTGTVYYYNTLLSTTATAPLADDKSPWTTSIPRTTSTTAVGTYRLYYWCKGDANHLNVDVNYINISVGAGMTTYTLPTLNNTKNTPTYWENGLNLTLITTAGSVTNGSMTYYMEYNSDIHYTQPVAPSATATGWTTNYSSFKQTEVGIYHVWVKVTPNSGYTCNNANTPIYVGYGLIVKDTIGVPDYIINTPLVYGNGNDVVIRDYTYLPYNIVNYILVPSGSSRPSTNDSGWSTEIPKCNSSVNAGNYTLYYYASGDEHYEDSNVNSKDIVIDKAYASATVTGNDYNYGSVGNTVTTTEVIGGTIYYYNSVGTNKPKPAIGTTSPWTTTIPKTTSSTNAGTHTMWYYVKGDNNHYDTDALSVTYTIVPVNLTVTAPTAKTGLTYGTTGVVANAGSVTGGTIYYNSNLNLSTAPARGVSGNWSTTIPSTLATTNAGTHRLYYYAKGDANHNDTAVSYINITVNKRIATLSWGTLSWDYTGSAHTTTCTVSNLVGSDTCTVTLSGNSITNVGTTTVTATALGNTNYTLTGASNTSKTLTVSPVYPDVSVTPKLVNTATLSGSSVSIVNPLATVSGGTAYYYVSKNSTAPTTMPTGGRAAVPTVNWELTPAGATSTGNWYGWYCVLGDGNHYDIPIAQMKTAANGNYTVVSAAAIPLSMTVGLDLGMGDVINVGTLTKGTITEINLPMSMGVTEMRLTFNQSVTCTAIQNVNLYNTSGETIDIRPESSIFGGENSVINVNYDGSTYTLVFKIGGDTTTTQGPSSGNTTTGTTTPVTTPSPTTTGGPMRATYNV